MVTTISSSAIRSSIVNSPSSLVISVRRSSPYFLAIVLQLVLEQRHALLASTPSSARSSLMMRADFLELLLQLLDLEAGELGEAHVEDRLGLPLGQLEPLLQLRARRRRVVGRRG